MRLSISLIFLFLLSFLISCSNCKQTQSGNDTNQYSPAAITQNLSIVNAEVVEVIGNGNDFKIKVKVISAEETEAYPGIAVRGEEYILTPNLRTEDGRLLNNEINTNLLSLRNLSKGQKFTAEISLDQKSGWIIQKVLK